MKIFLINIAIIFISIITIVFAKNCEDKTNVDDCLDNCCVWCPQPYYSFCSINSNIRCYGILNNTRTEKCQKIINKEKKQMRLILGLIFGLLFPILCITIIIIYLCKLSHILK